MNDQIPAGTTTERPVAVRTNSGIVVLLIAAVVGLLVLSAYLLWPPRPHRRVAEYLLDGIIAGELTSAADLRGLTAFGSGNNRKVPISGYASDKQIEFPSSALFGKPLRYKLLSEEGIQWRIPRVENDARDCESARMIVDLQTRIKTDGKDLPLGESRYEDLSVSNASGCKYTILVGAALLRYSVETERGFFKMAFVVDRDSIYLVDVSV